MGALGDLQRAVADLLSADAALRTPGVTVLAVDKGDALLAALEAMGAAGILVAVGPPSATFRGDSSVGPVADGGARISVQVSEPAGTGRDQSLPSAVDVAERVAWLLHAANHDGADAAGRPALAVESVSPVPDEAAVVYSVLCRATLALDGEIAVRGLPPEGN